MSATDKSSPLGLDGDQLAACVACGLCLPHCPTFRVTGEEVASPRGRIAAMRQVESGASAITPEFLSYMDACVQCRGCETACPSGVPYGALMEQTRAAIAVAVPKVVPWWQRLAYKALGHHALIVVGSRAAAAAQRLRLVPPSIARRAGLPVRLPLRQPRLTSSGTDVWMFTGCVMDAWMRSTHRAVQQVIEATGAGVALPGRGGDCCGALHVHAGLTPDARRLAERVMRSMPGEAPILVDSAGCGAALKDYGHLLGTAEARAFASRVKDVHEWLAPRIAQLPAPRKGYRKPVVAVQDPCHLRHVQRAHLPVRDVLAPYVEIRELDDEGLCCGAGGAYSALHPDLAGDIRERKLAAISRSGVVLVASANPGCALHLAAAGLDVRHPLEYVVEAIDG
ncbi:MAG: (Fe-S)-binding protein [Acidimicrobiia bacterium]